MSTPSPMELLNNFPVDETKMLLKDVKSELKEAAALGEDEDGMLDILLHVIANLEKELEGVTKLNKLSKDRQARVFADMSLILQFLQAQEDQDFDDDFDDEDFEDEEEEEEE